MMNTDLEISLVIVDFKFSVVKSFTVSELTGWQGFSASNLRNYSIGVKWIAGLTN